MMYSLQACSAGCRRLAKIGGAGRIGRWCLPFSEPAIERRFCSIQKSAASFPFRGFSQLLASLDPKQAHKIIIPGLDSPKRTFSSRGNRKNNSQSLDIIANEELLFQLRQKFRNAQGPEDIEVRLVIDEGPGEPATVKVCSLAEGIQESLDRMSDLIGVALQNDPPVIRVASISKLEYQRDQAAAKQKSAARSKQKKTFRFRAGIDVADLDRKIQEMSKFLEKGVECEYTVFSKARMLRENAEAGMDLVDRIHEMVSEIAVPKNAPKINEHGNHIRVHLIPKKN